MLPSSTVTAAACCASWLRRIHPMSVDLPESTVRTDDALDDRAARISRSYGDRRHDLAVAMRNPLYGGDRFRLRGRLPHCRFEGLGRHG